MTKYRREADDEDAFNAWQETQPAMTKAELVEKWRAASQGVEMKPPLFNHIEKDGVVIASFASREDAELFRRAKWASDLAERIDAQEVGHEVFRGVPIKWVETDAELESAPETRMCDLCWQRKPWGPHLINFCDDCVRRNLDAFAG